MKYFAFLLTLFYLLSPQLEAQNYCRVTGYLYKEDGSLAINTTVTIKKITNLNGEILVNRPSIHYTNSNGLLNVRLFKNSIAWIYADLPGMRGDNNSGQQIVIPNADTASIGALLNASAIYVYQEGSQVDTLTLFTQRFQNIYDSLAQHRFELDNMGPGVDTLTLFTQRFQNIYDSLVDHGIRLVSVELLSQLALDIANGKGDADSLKAVYDSLINVRSTLDGHAAAIAAAGKWEQSGSRIEPKAGIDTVTVGVLQASEFAEPAGYAGFNFTGHPDSYGEVGFYFGQGGSSNYLWSDEYAMTWIGSNAAHPNGGLRFAGTGSSSAGRKISFSPLGNFAENSSMFLSRDGKLGIGRQHPANRLEVAGNVWVNPDSAAYTNNLRPSSGTTISLGNNGLDYVGNVGLINASLVYNRSKGYGRPYISFNDYDLDFKTTAGTILRVRETGGAGGDSAVQIGEPTATRGLHVYGGGKFEGDVTGVRLRTPASSSFEANFGGTAYALSGATIHGISGYTSGSYTNLMLLAPSGRWAAIGAGSSVMNGVQFGSAGNLSGVTIARNGQLGLGYSYSATIPASLAHRLTVNGNISQHKDSISDLGPVQTPRLVVGTLSAGDSIHTVGSPTEKGGLHVYGGGLFEGAVTSRSSWVGFNGSVGVSASGNRILFGTAAILSTGDFGGSQYTWWSSGHFGSSAGFLSNKNNVSLKVDGHISQHKDSTLDAGIVVTPRIHWDTLGVQQSDTNQYYVDEVIHPITMPQTAVKQGMVKFRIAYSAGMAFPPTLVIQSDSANGVKLYDISFMGRGGRLLGGGFPGSVGGQIVNTGTSQLINWGYASTKAPRIFPVNPQPTNQLQYWRFSVMGVTNVHSDAHGTVEIEVSFQMPSGNTSDWYVDIREW